MLIDAWVNDGSWYLRFTEYDNWIKNFKFKLTTAWELKLISFRLNWMNPYPYWEWTLIINDKPNICTEEVKQCSDG